VDTPALDLRGGTTLWEAGLPPVRCRPLEENLSADIVIIGSGITGSFLAERLSRLDKSIVVLDRNQPQMASTAASTALLSWEFDRPLRELVPVVGFLRAAHAYRAGVGEVLGILELVRDLRIACHCIPRPSLYLAGSEMGSKELADEQRLRELARIPSLLVSESELGEVFGFRREAALYSMGCAEVNPVLLARGLANAAAMRGTRFFAPTTATNYDLSSREVTVLTERGYEVGARTLILASGYEMPSFVPAKIHRVVSTWAVATTAGVIPLWPQHALVWEASDPYLYMRYTADHRIVVGGGDENLTDAELRDRKIPAKSDTLLAMLQDMRTPVALPGVDYAWGGFFGETDDGLPLIGPMPGHNNVFAAYGYGGNGIAFSALAARLIGELISGDRRDPLLDCFAIDRQ
jgi:glycine/D-amino acid oxidase-like deaminating enzyme